MKEKSDIFLVQSISMDLATSHVEVENQDTRSEDLNDDDDAKINAVWYGILTLLILILAPFSFTLLPVNNIFTSPECWYEFIFTTSSWQIFYSVTSAISIDLVLKDLIKKKLSRIIMELFLSVKITEILLICTIHLIWSDILGYYEPFPFRQMLTAYLSYLASLAKFWCMIPRSTKFDPLLRNRCKAYIPVFLVGIFVSIQLVTIAEVLARTPLEFQWVIALLFPLTKEINDRINVAWITKSASSENLVEATFMVKIRTNLGYSFWYAIFLSGTATKTTELILLGVNFIINMTLCYKVMRLHNKISGANAESSQDLKKQIMTALILNEFVDVVVPLAFIATFSIAHNGPNRQMLWNVREVTDLLSFLIPVAEMALIDAGSLVLAGILLWKFCRISILEEYCMTIGKYWKYVAPFGGATISAVSDNRINQVCTEV